MHEYNFHLPKLREHHTAMIDVWCQCIPINYVAVNCKLSLRNARFVSQGLPPEHIECVLLCVQHGHSYDTHTHCVDMLSTHVGVPHPSYILLLVVKLQIRVFPTLYFL